MAATQTQTIQALQPLFNVLQSVPTSRIPAVNVATVPQRSPLRYPGGKTWLIPHIREWLTAQDGPAPLLVEPFTGGGIVSLTAVMEGLAEHALMVELDRDIAALWKSALHHGPALIDRVMRFEPTRRRVEALERSDPIDVVDRGFRTLVLNRVKRGGILAAGATFSRAGENGKGLKSRWYPETLARRIQSIFDHSRQISFIEGDGVRTLETLDTATMASAALFIDPPYTAGGKRAGKRLYTHHNLDHVRLFEILSSCSTNFLMTYDAAPEILSLVKVHGYHVVSVLMKNTHHNHMSELVITRRRMFEVS